MSINIRSKTKSKCYCTSSVIKRGLSTPLKGLLIVVHHRLSPESGSERLKFRDIHWTIWRSRENLQPNNTVYYSLNWIRLRWKYDLFFSYHSVQNHSKRDLVFKVHLFQTKPKRDPLRGLRVRVDHGDVVVDWRVGSWSGKFMKREPEYRLYPVFLRWHRHHNLFLCFPDK